MKSLHPSHSRNITAVYHMSVFLLLCHDMSTRSKVAPLEIDFQYSSDGLFPPRCLIVVWLISPKYKYDGIYLFAINWQEAYTYYWLDYSSVGNFVLCFLLQWLTVSMWRSVYQQALWKGKFTVCSLWSPLMILLATAQLLFSRLLHAPTSPDHCSSPSPLLCSELVILLSHSVVQW